MKRAKMAGQLALTLCSLGAVLIVSGCGLDMDAPVFGSAQSKATQTPPPSPTRASTPITAISEPTISSVFTATPPAQTSIATSTPNDPTQFWVNVHLTTTITQPISPFIYGIADSSTGNDSTISWLGATLARWGGNARSRFNWELNTTNGGADNGYANTKKGDDVPGSASLGFLDRNYRLNLASILTIPTIGWVAKDGSSASKDVPAHGGPAVGDGTDSAFTRFADGKWTTPYDPAANRAATSLQSLPSKGAPFSYPPDLTDNKVSQDEWVDYLRSQRKQGEAPPIYAMDNEPDLWADNTHVDIHPARMSYSTTLSTFQVYAAAVKKADPTSMVAGPESWGLPGYLYSALDEGGDSFTKAADQAAHGNMPFIEWFLRSLQTADKASGARSLDILSLHYYPTGGEYTGGNTPALQDSRMQAPRALWDGLYTVPGWMSRTEWSNLALLRRMNDLIKQAYPGTKLGLTEWNFGGENDISGAIATADTLGILGREGVYMASYWGLPDKGSPAGWAFRMFRNYDGKGARFGSQSVATQSSNTQMFSTYSALDTNGSTLTVMLINKDRARTANISVALGDFTASPAAKRYHYGADNLAGITESPMTVPSTGDLSVAVPPMSIELVKLTRAGAQNGN